MSHIPSSAMHHAKVHEPDPTPPPAAEAEPVPVKVPPHREEAKPFPWLAVVIGGALAAGTAITAVVLTRKPAPPVRRKPGPKPGTPRGTTTPRQPRRKKADAAG